MIYNDAFYSAMSMDSADTINSFKEHYGVDLKNCKNYAMAKMQIEAQTLGKITEGWQKYYNIQTNTFSKEYQALLGLNEQGDGGKEIPEREKEAVIETIDWIERKNQILKDSHDSLMELANDEAASYEERRDALKEVRILSTSHASSARGSRTFISSGLCP